MPRSLRVVTVLVMTLAYASVAVASHSQRTRSGDGILAEVKVRRGRQTVMIEGELAWPTGGKGKTLVTSPLRFSPSGDALAFAARQGTGAVLVVLIVAGPAAG